MSLSSMDDYPIHQIAQPIRQVATSDRNFYDRYYFNVQGLDSDVVLTAGFAAYPNLGTFDGFAAIAFRGKQTVVRASRELTIDRSDTSVGPFRVEVLEGLKRLRVVLEPNEWGFEFDLVFDGSMNAYQEPRHLWRQYERVVLDTCRFAQTGKWSGTLSIDGERFAVRPGSWWGARDRSWGIRAVGEPEPQGIRVKRSQSFFHNYAQMQFKDHSILYIAQENRDGTRILEEAVRIWHDPSRPPEHLGRPAHDLSFIPGSRIIESGAVHLGHGPDGAPMTVAVKPGVAVHLRIGTGYGFDPDWRHGMYQGALKVEGLTADLAAISPAKATGMYDTLARFEYDGNVGFGLWEYMISGPHDQYGFESWKDGYRAAGA